MNTQIFHVLDDTAVTELLGVLPSEILKILRDVYPEGKIFKELKMNIEDRLQEWLSRKNKSNSLTDQAIYYQLRKLKDLGFIETSAEKELDANDRLITSQKYKLTSLQYVINFSEHLATKTSGTDDLLLSTNSSHFLQKFTSEGKFNGHIVVGKGSSDGPFIGSLSYLLGKYFDLTNTSFVLYDNIILDDPDDKKVKYLLSQNLILLGGPNVNRVFQSPVPSKNGEHKSLNEVLPVKFVQAPSSGLIIQETGKIILSKDRKIGVIQQIDNPWNPANKIVAIGGSRKIGTEAAVIAFTQSFDQVEKCLLKQHYCLIEAIVNDREQIIETRII